MDLNRAVQALLQEFIDRDVEQGLQVAAYYRGELVVDTWAGLADATSGRMVDGDTLFAVYSANKGVIATTIHLLVERGEVTYDTPVAHVWPEFRAGGKDRITLRHVLTHTAALPHMPADVTRAGLGDPDAVCRAVARLSPLWTPGATIAYHAMTFGLILGEVVRRVTGMPFAQFVQTTICAPLAIDSMFFGLPSGTEGYATQTRLAAGEGVRIERMIAGDPIARRSVPHPAPDAAPVQIHAMTGIMNARALARHYAALVGEVAGVRLLSPVTVAYAGRPHRSGIDANGGSFTPFALGYHCGRPGGSMGDRAAVFGHGGFGGTLAFADPDYEMAFALTKNRTVIPPHNHELVAYQVSSQIRRALGIATE